jgi:serine/threonine-protein kinase
MPPDLVPDQIVNGKYRILGPIGSGGMGKIYKAEQLALGRVVAIKVLSLTDQQGDSATFERRFFLEASLCAKLSHPNIVTIHDYGRIEDEEHQTLFIAMEFLDGLTLLEYLKTRGGWVGADAATYFAMEIARGLRVAHKAGVVHRDLKPGNVMLVGDDDGGIRVKILDFGLVKNVHVEDDEKESLTRQGQFVGSPAYMAPEQVMSGRSIDQRTDIYSLGVILFKCLTGKAPFSGDQNQVVMAHVNSPVPELRDRNPSVDVPPMLEALIRRMMSKPSEDRPQTIDEVLRELKAIRDALGVATEPVSGRGSVTGGVPLIEPPQETPTRSLLPPVSLSQVPIPAPSKPRRVAMLVAAGLGVIAVGLVGTMLALRNPPRPTGTAPIPPPAPVVTPIVTPPPAPPPAAPVPAPPSPPPVEEPTVAPAPVTSHSPGKPTHSPSSKHVAASPKTPVEKPPAPPTAPAAPVEEEFGFLSLDSTPWSNVREGSHSLGVTPLVKLKLSAGTHTLTLENPESKKGTTYTVTIHGGQTVSKRIGFE